MLGSWFQRGLGQIVAPDEKAAAATPPEGEGTLQGFWHMVAPDPNFESPQHGEASEKRGAPASTTPLPSSGSHQNIQCVFCQEMMPVAPSTPLPGGSHAATTPSGLECKVLSAAKETAGSMISPPSVAEARNKVFRLCASSKPLSEKLCQRLRRLLENDISLINVRASHLGNLVPDGYTPLMAAASVNHVAAAKVILDVCPEATQDVDLQGRTSLHIAAELACMDMVDLLLPLHAEGKDAPVDLTGHTPLGRAVTSKSAKGLKSQLQQKLFSPGDVSICGKPTPAKTRSCELNLSLMYGHADMPGFRVTMEDALSCHAWDGHALLGVCDGHGDEGRVSAFVAENVASLLKQNLSSQDDIFIAFHQTCLTLDAKLKDTGIKGGSTAVWALVTECSMAVANVGDSRCILVHKKPSSSLEQAMEKLTIAGGDDEARREGVAEPTEDTKGETLLPPPDSEKPEEGVADPTEADREETPSVQSDTTFVVTPLSEDHKPNSPGEKSRIEKAGLTVVAEKFMEDGKEQTIHKVQRSEMDRLAVSRSFGDFEYKGNSELDAEEQAVVAVPEIRIHARDAERDMYLVLACDGVWDVMSSQEVGDFVVSRAEAAIEAEEQDVLPKVGDALLEECLQRGSMDNLTTIIVALSKTAESLGGGSVLKGKALDFQAE